MIATCTRLAAFSLVRRWDTLAFTRQLVALRKAHPVFRRRRFLAGAAGAAELGWFTPAGTAMTSNDWADGSALAVAVYLDGSDEPDRAADGSPMVDDDFLVLVNAWWQPLGFTVPATRRDGLADRDRHLRPRHTRRLAPRGRPAHRLPPLDHRAPRPPARRWQPRVIAPM